MAYLLIDLDNRHPGKGGYMDYVILEANSEGTPGTMEAFGLPSDGRLEAVKGFDRTY